MAWALHKEARRGLCLPPQRRPQAVALDNLLRLCAHLTLGASTGAMYRIVFDLRYCERAP
jgi:hypothetical protein